MDATGNRPRPRYRCARRLRRERKQPLVRIIPRPGQSADEIDQHMKRWRKEIAFVVAQHPHLVAKARKLGIVLDEDDPGTTH